MVFGLYLSNREACLSKFCVTSVIFSEKETGKVFSCGNIKDCFCTFSDLELYVDMRYFNIEYLLILFVGSLDSKLRDVVFLWHVKRCKF